MAKPYSMDLRDWVVRTVTAEGMSCHAAAARFGVAPSSAIKRMRRYRDTGSAAPGRIRRAVRAVGVRLVVLRPYSPDLKPIEQVFAKLKRPPNDPMRRHGAASARSSTPSPQTNATTASATPDMRQRDLIMI
jgi:transposase-like protein